VGDAPLLHQPLAGGPHPRAWEVLKSATIRLAAVSDTPRLDAELLMAHAFGVSRNALLLNSLDSPAPEEFEALLERRLRHEPIAYITGTRDFWTITLSVAPEVLIPRPDSETLIQAAVDYFGTAGPARILDLGTGPGTLLLAALDQWSDAYGLGVDQSERALGLAEINAIDLGLEERARFQQGDWAAGLEGQFDLILCNPPYVEEDADLSADVGAYEPHDALFAGADGLDDYRIIIPQLPALLAPGGMVAMEIGHLQAASVSALFVQVSMAVQVARDLAGRDRALIHFALGNHKETG
jgi:release factor glutamine methyltransferase